jgi:hypothetical protein
MPFGVQGFRTQILIDAAQIGPTGALINGMRFRADRPSLPLASSSVPNVTIKLSETLVPLGNLDPTFALNVTGVETTVFSGTVTLPAHTDAHAGPMPWDIVIPFSAPFGFQSLNGNLLVDITANNPSGGAPVYYLDAMRRGGSATKYGTGGPNPSGDFLNLVVSTNGILDPRQMTLGNTIEYASTTFFTTPPGLLMLGLAPTPFPVDLTPFGGPGQFLHVDPLVLSAHVWQQSFIGWYSSFLLQVPVDPSWIDDTIYAQSLVFDAGAGPLGVVLSHAVETRIGDNAPQVHSMQQVDADDPNAVDGTVINYANAGPGAFGAVAVQLEGIFF